MLFLLFLLGKNKVTADFFYMTDHGISIAEIYNYVVYYGVILLIVLPALLHGRRASCHYICWMAPFMIIGKKIGQLLHVPLLHIEARKEKCIGCGKCSQVCPMGLDVVQMVQKEDGFFGAECIVCGACADNCPKKVLYYSMKRRKR